MLDHAVADDQGQPLVQRQPVGGERGQAEFACQPQAGIRKHLERQVQALDHLALVIGVLAGQAEHSGRARGEKVVMVVPEAARFGGTAACSRD
ncbi:MAG TPA: hypothetical protein VF070_07350 [Streptosporangiaceae bacterium]